MDPSQFHKGFVLFNGNILNAKGEVVHPVIYKEYATQREYDEDCAKYPDYSQEVDAELAAEFEDDLDLFHEHAPIEEFFSKDQNGNNKGVQILPIAQYLVHARHVISVTGVKRDIYVYRKGVYVIGDDILKKDVRHLLKSWCTTYYTKEIVEAMKDITSIEREEMNVPVTLVNLDNGVLDINTGDLFPHDAKYFFFTKIPVKYEPARDCPAIKKFLADVLDEQQIIVIQEWFGYCLYREYFIKKALILFGETDTGKSTLLGLMIALLGQKNTSGVSLQRLTYDKFAASAMYNKHLNFYDDLSEKDINDNGAFKIATGGGYVSGEKKFKDQFVFKNYAKLAFACNKIPDVKQADDDAYFNRWIVVHFSRILEEDKKDKQLMHKMTTPEELSGLLNFAYEGLQRLLRNKDFSYEKNIHEIKTEMMRSASTIARFASDCLEEASGEWISKDDMYHAYADYASRNKIPAVTMKTFGGRLPMHVTHIADFKPKDPSDPTGKKQIKAWRNVRFKINSTDSTDIFEP